MSAKNKVSPSDIVVLPATGKYESPPAVIWVGCDDAKKRERLVSDIRDATSLYRNSVEITSSANDQKSMMEVMTDLQPNFFAKSVKHTYQAMYEDYSQRLHGIEKILTTGDCVESAADKQTLIDGAKLLLPKKPSEPTDTRTTVQITEERLGLVSTMVFASDSYRGKTASFDLEISPLVKEPV